MGLSCCMAGVGQKSQNLVQSKTHLKPYFNVSSFQLGHANHSKSIILSNKRHYKNLFKYINKNSNVICAASASHAIYQLDIREKHHDFFENCVEETIRHLDEAPFIQTLSSFDNLNFKRFKVSSELHTWKQCMDFIDVPDTELMMFIHPVRKNGSSDNYHRSFNNEQCFSDKLLLPHKITGKVGKCCEEEDHNDHENHNDDPNRGHQIENEDKNVKYWGLIIQSNGIYPLNGAYLMKTMKNSELYSCSCTHYSLIKVSEGISLSEQLTTAWII